ncbi:hypothetical protein G6O69_38535 [Pseudenhygromyxa sp. WMMC2535]|uniref:hypothetical protein n=1 Tax=Pseudenhygromyxa sp. WMMC2535 TaxID=2712867 RepID=UPI001595588C|nr:hypothetical protein [Pseudenhygromyxa sp. WMMC2535]NVB43760.1 hypothetical protein [Pseudenhygromyxa sp. WMMC2535]
MFSAFDGPLRWIFLVAALWVSYLLATHQPIRAGLLSPIFLATELPFLIWFANQLINNFTAIWGERPRTPRGPSTTSSSRWSAP